MTEGVDLLERLNSECKCTEDGLDEGGKDTDRLEGTVYFIS